MRITTEQFETMYSTILAEHSDNLRKDINAHLGKGVDVETPLTRLVALRTVIQSQLDPAHRAFLGVDVDVSADMLRAAITRGTPYQEDMAAAMLYAAAALGATWFSDARLLAMNQLLDGNNRPSLNIVSLFDPNLSVLFDLATTAAADIQSQAPYYLQEMLQNHGAEQDLRQVSEAIFFGKSPQALQHFIGGEQQVFKQYQITDRPLQMLCYAGDFIFGIGRCVRFIHHRHTDRSSQEKQLILKETLLGMV